MKTKKLLTVLMALGLSVASVGCGGGDSTGGYTPPTGSIGSANGLEINIMNFGGGLGRKWLDESAARFSEKVADKEYVAGKKGVKFNIQSTTNTGNDSMSGSGMHMYFDQGFGNLKAKIAKGDLLEITDIMDDTLETINGQEVTLLDKLQDSHEHSIKSVDGKYYGLPHYEWFPGLTYDVERFESDGLYFADAAETNTTSYTCALVGKTANFVKNANGKKSVGNDGVYGTSDDGMPTSLEELIILCDYMKTKKGITPFTVAGGHIDYFNNLTGALWASLAGGDEMEVCYSFTGDVNVVTGYTTENLFAGYDGVKKPVVGKKTLNGVEDGHWTTQSAARYYAVAFEELANKQGWFSADSTNGNSSHLITQTNFVLNGMSGNEKMGMLIEGSYWYNESVNASVFDNYSIVSGKGTRELGWMSMPTSLNETVTEGNGKEMVFLDYGTSYAFINGNLAGKADKEPIVEACKDFLKFLYTDAELKAFTRDSGSMKAGMDYTMSEEDYGDMAEFQKSILELRKNGHIVYQTADNDKAASRKLDCSVSIFRPTIEGVPSSQYLSQLRAGRTAKEIFEATSLSKL